MDQRGPEWTRVDQSGPEGTRVDQRGPEGTRGTRRDQRGPEGTRNRNTARDPVGWRQFAKQLRSANIPLELVGNDARRKHMQKPTPTKRRRKSKFVIPAGWESY